MGARRILDWLKIRNAAPQYFVAVGDSASDLEMADEVSSQGKSVDFYYVRPKEPLKVEKPYNIITTTAEYDKGAVEVFEGLAA